MQASPSSITTPNTLVGPEDWVKIFLQFLNDNTCQGRATCERACKELEPVIRQEAGKAAKRKRLDDYQMEELCEDAARYFLFDSRLFEKKQPQRISRYDAACGRSLRAWLYIKLTGRARNYLAHKPLGHPEKDRVQAKRLDNELVSQETIEKVLAFWSEEPVPFGVDYYAVFAMIVWQQTTNSSNLECGLEESDNSDLMIRLPKGTDGRSFKVNWPVLGEIWRGFRNSGIPVAAIDDKTLCELVRGIPGGPATFNRSLWHKWVSVARQKAKNKWWDECTR